MRAQMFLVLCVATFFTACEKDADFAQAPVKIPSADILKSYASGNYDFEDVIRDAVTLDYCIELNTSHWLVGFGKLEPLREEIVNESYISRIPTGLYVIEASGDGMSADYARCTSELKLTFNSRTNRLTGSMISKFYKGEVLEQKFDEDAVVLYDSQAMILKASVLKAQFNTGSELLSLVKGEIIIALPIKPEGWFETNIYTTGMFCTAVVK